MAELSIVVGGMNCGHCTAQVKNTLESLAPGLAADVELERGRARLSGDTLPDAATLAAALTRVGFTYGGVLDE
jgi:copper chaperone CopZ